MTHQLCDSATQFDDLVSFAGRISYEQYSKEIFDIINKIEEFLNSKRHLDAMKEIGKVYFDIGGKQFPLTIKIFDDKGAPVNAGVDTQKKDPELVFNIADFKYSSPNWQRTKDIKKLIVHEVTHFIDAMRNPITHQHLTDSDTEFFEDFTKAFLTHPSKTDYTNIETFDGSLERSARKSLLKFVKTKAFKDLLAKHNRKMDYDLMGKLLKNVQALYLEDMGFFRDTGGDPLGTNPRDPDTIKGKQVGRQLYYQSDAEMKAHTNHILEEIIDYLRETDHSKMLIEFINGKASIARSLDVLLAHSPTFTHIQKYLREEQLKSIYREVARAIQKLYPKKTSKDWEERAGVKLNSHEQLMFRQIMKLYNTNPNKLDDLLSDEDFISKNIKPLTVFQEVTSFDSAIDKIKKSFDDLDL